MSRKANDRYVLRLWVFPLLAIGSLVGIVVLFAGGIGAGADTSPTLRPLFTLGGAFLAVAAIVFARQWALRNLRSSYLKGLQNPGPNALIALLSPAMKSFQSLPDGEAFAAQSRALPYILYGREAEATDALAEVDWKSKAPLVQAAGLSAEGLIELLCHRDVQRALVLTREARTLAAVSPKAPGAAQTVRTYETFVALCEALDGSASPDSVKRLEASAANDRWPALQILASFGLAAAMERAGNAERANELWEFLRQAAPHCAPLQLKPGAFREAATRGAALPLGPVSASLSDTSRPAPTPPPMPRFYVNKRLVLWVFLVLMFLFLWQFFSPHATK